MTSKCGKNKKVAHKVQSSFEHIMTSSVICYNDCTHLRQQGIYLLYKMKRKKFVYGDVINVSVFRKIINNNQ